MFMAMWKGFYNLRNWGLTITMLINHLLNGMILQVVDSMRVSKRVSFHGYESMILDLLGQGAWKQFQTYIFPKWCFFPGDLPWYKVNSRLKQTKDYGYPP